MTNQNQTPNKKPAFVNLRKLSEINNQCLTKMNEETVGMRNELEGIAKNVRVLLREIDSKNEQKTSSATPQPAKPEYTERKVIENQERKTFVRQFDLNRNQNGARPQQRDQNRQNGGTQRFNNNGNRDNNFRQDRRPQQGQGQQNGAIQNRPKRDNTTSNAVQIDIPLNTNKRVFERKKDDRKKTNFDDFNRSNKRSLMRRGLLEENSIEERIRSNRKLKNKKQKEQQAVVSAPIGHAVITTETITVKQLSEKTGRSVADILKQLMVLGMMSNVNSSIDFTTAELVASELGVVLEQKLEKSYEEKLAEEFGGVENGDDERSEARPPIVAVLGHVDHGKTSLLDFIRKTHIQSQEAGGITQNISAYQIKTMDRLITFIDTPGHEAFSAMRARGASVTDIAILVVAGDDGVKPQTLEAIKHIKSAKIPMIVAVNKMDKAEANFERVKQQLAEADVMPEEWGGDTIFVPISALTGQGVDKLLEMVLLVADMNELKANPDRNALAMVIEAKLDKGKGPIATAIILNGTLKVGDTIISGVHAGKVRALLDDKGKNIKKALPSAPVSILGLDGVPNAGDQLYAVDAKFSRDVLAERKRKIQQDKINAKNAFSMEEFLAKSADTEKKVLNIIVKADVQGSFEALTEILNKINNEEVRVECIHGGVGPINENDVLLAKNANAIIVGFNVKPDSKAGAVAEHGKVQIFLSKIIYQITEFVSKTIKGMREPVFEEQVIGHAEVIRTFKISRIGTVAGCIVKDGKITKNCKIRLLRKGEKIVETTITTLQRDRVDVKEVVAGMECGIKMEGHNDILLEDMIEAFVMVEVERD